MNENDVRPNSLAKVIAPEDLNEGDLIAVLNVVDEIVPMLLMREAWQDSKAMEPLRVMYLPCGDPAPMKVEAVCLPFVLVKQADGVVRTIDVRRYRLARLPVDYGKRVWKLLKEKRSGKASSCDD